MLTGQNIYFHLNHPIRWVRHVGILVDALPSQSAPYRWRRSSASCSLENVSLCKNYGTNDRERSFTQTLTSRCQSEIFLILGHVERIGRERISAQTTTYRSLPGSLLIPRVKRIDGERIFAQTVDASENPHWYN